MKKYLSLFLVIAFMLSMIPTSVSADTLPAELKSVSVTGADICPAFSSGIYNYEIIVLDEDAPIPDITYVLNDGDTASIINKAEYLGETTSLKVTGVDNLENTYNFTYRVKYLSETTSATLEASDLTSVSKSKGDDVYSDWYANSSDRIYTKGTGIRILLKFDFTGLNANPFDTFTLSYSQRNKDVYSDNEIIIQTLSGSPEWTKENATYNNTLTSSPSFDTAKATFEKTNTNLMVDVDISDVIRNKLLKGETKMTLCIWAKDSGTTLMMRKDTIPKITYKKIKKSEGSGLKDVVIKDSIFDTPFKTDDYEYEIAIPDNETPNLKYVLNDSFSTADYTPAENIGDTAIVKVTSQDGTNEKTYNFKFISYSDAGVSIDGKLTLISQSIRNSVGEDVLSFDNMNEDSVTFNADVKNLNLSSKNLTMVTVVKKDGKIIDGGVKIKTFSIPLGNHLAVSDEITLPLDLEGITVEGYLFDKDLKTTISEKTMVPYSAYTPEISETEETLSFASSANDFIIYGKGEAESLVPVVLIKPDKTITNLTVSDTTSVAGFDVVKADSNGIWETKVVMPTDVGYYTAYIPSVTDGKKKLYASENDKMTIINTVYDKVYDSVADNEHTAEENAKAGIKTTLGLADANNLSDDILGVNYSSNVNEDGFINTLYNLIKEKYNTKPSATESADIEEFISIFDLASDITKLNQGITVTTDKVIDRAEFTDLVSLYNDVSETGKTILDTKIINKNIENKSALYTLIKTEIIFALINYSENTSIAQSAVETYGAYIGLDLSGYNNVTSKSLLIIELVNKGPFTSVSTLQSSLNLLVPSYLKPVIIPGGATPSKPQSGLSGLSGVSGTVVKDDIHTEEFNKEPVKYFGDVETDNWAYEPTKYLNEKGILKGMDNGNFEPNRSIKREEFAKILVLAFNLQAKSEDKLFTDVKDTEWYYEYVKIAAQNGIINGIGDGVFGVSIELSRQDIAVMIARVLNKNEASEEIFNDDSEISSYAKDAVYTLKNLGVLNGTGNGNFEPKRSVTRAECAKIVYELIKE